MSHTFCDVIIGNKHAFGLIYVKQDRLEPFLFNDRYTVINPSTGDLNPYKDEDNTKASILMDWYPISYNSVRDTIDTTKFSDHRELAIVNIYRNERNCYNYNWVIEKKAVYTAYAVVRACCHESNHIVSYKVENDGNLFKVREDALDYLHGAKLNELLLRVEKLENILKIQNMSK